MKWFWNNGWKFPKSTKRRKSWHFPRTSGTEPRLGQYRTAMGASEAKRQRRAFCTCILLYSHITSLDQGAPELFNRIILPSLAISLRTRSSTPPRPRSHCSQCVDPYPYTYCTLILCTLCMNCVRARIQYSVTIQRRAQRITHLVAKSPVHNMRTVTIRLVS